jgi:hypothetical protein
MRGPDLPNTTIRAQSLPMPCTRPHHRTRHLSEPNRNGVRVQAISVQQPWAFAIARSGGTIANQGFPTAYRGPLLVHASMRVDLKACDHPLIQAAGWDPNDPLATIGAVIAVAELDDVCSASVHGTPCDCGPWAERGAHHWRLINIRALPRPVVALGRTDLWKPPHTLLTKVESMLTAAKSPS